MFLSILQATAILLLVVAAVPAHDYGRSSQQLESNTKLTLRPTRPMKTDYSKQRLAMPARNILSLKRTNGARRSALALRTAVVNTTPLASLQYQSAYAVEIDFSGQAYDAIFDTGSSDLWLASSNLQCVDQYQGPLAVASCSFGPLAPATFPEGSIANQNFDLAYGDGTFVSGVLGYADVCLAGISVQHQEVALVNRAYWDTGDNVTSGLVGFAYPELTSAYNGTNPAQNNRSDPAALRPYQTWFLHAVAEGAVDPVFSLALERGDSTGGQLALGGLPTVDFYHNFTSTPMLVYDLSQPSHSPTTNFSFYAIAPDGLVVQGAGKPETFLPWSRTKNSSVPYDPAIVDSGTTLTYLPYTLAQAINNLFDPPASGSVFTSSYRVACNATVPKLALRVNGTDFPFDKRDLIFAGLPGDAYCTSGIAAGPKAYLLGDTFLKSVVAVFDVGRGEMRFAPHEY